MNKNFLTYYLAFIGIGFFNGIVTAQDSTKNFKEITYYYSWQKTGPGHNDFGNTIPKIVYLPSAEARYLKKNVVLTNRYTASGAEHSP